MGEANLTKLRQNLTRHLWLSVSLWSIFLANYSVSCIYKIKSSCDSELRTAKQALSVGKNTQAGFHSRG